MDNFELGMFFGFWSIVTYILCQFFYNKGHDDGLKYSSRVIGVASVKKKTTRTKKKKWYTVIFMVMKIGGRIIMIKTDTLKVSG